MYDSLQGNFIINGFLISCQLLVLLTKDKLMVAKYAGYSSHLDKHVACNWHKVLPDQSLLSLNWNLMWWDSRLMSYSFELL